MHLDQLKAEKRIWLRFVIVGILLTCIVLIAQHGASIWLRRQLPQLEQALTQATGLNTRIGGTVSATLFPIPGFVLGNIEMDRDGKQVITARELRSDFEFLPLFDGQLIVHGIAIDGMDLRLIADEHGFPVLPSAPASPPAAASQSALGGLRLGIPDVLELRDANLTVSSAEGKELYRLQQFNLALQPLHAIASGEEPQWTVGIYLNFKQATLQQLVIGPSQLTAQYRPGGLAADVNKATLFGGQAEGTVSWIDTEKAPKISTVMSLENFDAEQSAALFRKEPFIKGKLNLKASLSSSGSSTKDLLHHLSGSVKLTGADLELISADLDELVSRVINSQQYSLVDAAAYFFIGPLAASATKGVDVANVARELQKPGTTPTKIVRLVSSWNVDNGIATAQDVALETTRYRLALQGRVDLIKNEFDGVRIGVVNDQGCAIATQSLNGPFKSPRTEKLNILFRLARPLLGVLGQSASLLSNTVCEPFYKGELLPVAALEVPAATPEPDPDAR